MAKYMYDYDMAPIASDILIGFEVDENVPEEAIANYYNYATQTVEYLNIPQYSYEYIRKLIAKQCQGAGKSFSTVEPVYVDFLTKLKVYYPALNVDAYKELLRIFMSTSMPVPGRITLYENFIETYGACIDNVSLLDTKLALLNMYLSQVPNTDMAKMGATSNEVKALLAEVTNSNIPRY